MTVYDGLCVRAHVFVCCVCRCASVCVFGVYVVCGINEKSLFKTSLPPAGLPALHSDARGFTLVLKARITGWSSPY